MLDIILDQLTGGGVLLYLGITGLLTTFFLLSYRIYRRVFPRPVKTGEDEEFNQLLSDAGYALDTRQNIFYTKMNAWQRKCGYCRLYDEAAAPTCMIIDTDPITFEYGGKRWLIQFWKGQYYLNTGCEIGVYYTDGPDLNIPNLFTGTFYRCVDNADRLRMSCTLYKNGKALFHREEKHWWLTGFVLGEFSEPWELSVKIRITFKDANMCACFIRALRRIGYQDYEFRTNGISAVIFFDRTHTPQPITRTEETDWIIQRNNERVCDRFREVTQGCRTLLEKLQAIREKEPFLYEAVVNIGKTRQIFKAFDRLKSYV